jgi:hypothetical protein
VRAVLRATLIAQAFLPNGSARPLPQSEFQLIYPLAQGLEAQQHSQHPFELSVEVDLIAA